ncbi:MAG: helix-turn-helix domain-containing protein, partial [Actinomycetales bacterium]|nr:helix-turn-helix domain-containing protein [Actinomycetales bacterium]
FVPLAVHSDRPREFRADLVGCVSDGVLFSTISASAHAVERGLEQITRSTEPYVKLALQLRGEGMLVQDGREATLRPGDIAIYDTTRPYSLAFTDELTTFCVMFPHRMIDVDDAALRSLTAVRIAGEGGFAGVVARYLVGLAGSLGTLDARTSLRATHNTMDLVSTMLQHALGVSTQGDAYALLCQRIDGYINAHLDDPRLSPERIAQATYISTRYLHAIFHRRGTTVSRWVRERRLEHARRELLSPRGTRRTVAQVATAWGFVDASHFSKVFRERFGVSPTQYRLDPAR